MTSLTPPYLLNSVSDRVKKIIIFSHEGDTHLSFVTRHLEGEEVVLINPSDLVDGTTFDFYFDGHHSEILYKDKPLGPVKSVWLRRPVPVENRKVPVSKAVRNYARNAIQRHANMLGQAFEDALWISEPSAILTADIKILQLRLAARLGLNVPETLFASSGRQARAFVERRGVCIVKSQATEHPKDRVAMTRIIKRYDALNYDALHLDPYTFQQYIEPAYELRVTVVGDKVFTARVEGKEIDGITSKHRDWRYAHVNDTFNARRAGLPRETAEACRRLVKGLNLEFGAIDHR